MRTWDQPHSTTHIFAYVIHVLYLYGEYLFIYIFLFTLFIQLHHLQRQALVFWYFAVSNFYIIQCFIDMTEPLDIMLTQF